MRVEAEIQGSLELLDTECKLCEQVHEKKKKNLGKAYITYIRFELGKKKRVKNFNMKHLSIEQ